MNGKYAVCGNGPFAAYVGNALTAGIFEKLPPDDPEIILVCYEKYRQRQDAVCALLRAGCKNILIVDPCAWKGRLPLQHADGSFCSYVRRAEEVKPVLPYFEFHVTDFCNLKCRNCGHHANEVKELSFASLSVFKEALQGLAAKFENVATARLMGGEPLLAPNVHEYADLVLSVFPRCRVKIATNGLLLTKMPQPVLDYLRAHPDIEVQITQYPPFRRYAEEVVSFCRENRISLSLSEPTEAFFNFGSRSALEGAPGSMTEQWERCLMKDCHFLRGRRLYFCTKSWVEEEFFGQDMKNASFDVVDDPVSGWDILSAAGNPFFLCAYCRFPYPMEKWSAENGDAF